MLKIAILFAISACSFAQLYPRDDCDRPCQLILSPVCGSNRVTYANKCVLEIAMCKDKSIKFEHNGKCLEDIDFCNPIHSCPRLYDPVCGTDGKTYNNDCLFKKAVCNHRELEKAHKGRCEDSETSYLFGG